MRTLEAFLIAAFTLGATIWFDQLRGHPNDATFEIFTLYILVRIWLDVEDIKKGKK